MSRLLHKNQKNSIQVHTSLFLKQRLRDFQIFFVPVGADLVEYQFAQKSASNKVHTYLNVI